jgi:hypothetical protein
VVVTLEEFSASLAAAAAPAGLGAPLQALWWAGKDDWDKAHTIAMEASGTDAAWVHAYLHRVEGDTGNAHYWYRQARREPATGALRNEWETIAAELLARR